MVTRSEFRTTCEECGVPLYEEGQRYSCPCCNQPICRKCHRQLKQTMVTRRELELDLIERHSKALRQALYESHSLKDIATVITLDEAHQLGIDPRNAPLFFGHPIIVVA